MITQEFYGDTTNLTGEIVKNSLIIQSFIAKESKLVNVGIHFATYRRKNWALITVEILNQDGQIIKSCVINSQKFNDNCYSVFNLNCNLEKDKRYFLKVYTENGQIGHTITAKWGYRKHVDEVFYLNDDARRGELACYFEFDDEKSHDVVKQTFEDGEYKKGLISVIIPCYNSSKIIKPTLESLEKQTYNNLEIIIVDDASDDIFELETVIGKYDCELINLNENKGACNARNVGEAQASGEYLFFCDSDVTLNEKCLQEMLQALHEYPDCDWAYCNFAVGDDVRSFYPYDKKTFFKRNCSSTMSLMRHRVFCGFDVNIKRLQDWDLFLTIAENGSKGIWVNAFLFSALDREGITNNSIDWDTAIKELKEKHLELGQ